jgi:hypothetical protein
VTIVSHWPYFAWLSKLLDTCGAFWLAANSLKAVGVFFIENMFFKCYTLFILLLCLTSLK